MRKILAIKSSRFPNRAYLKFDDGFFIPIFLDDLVILKLNQNQEIGEEKFNSIIKASLFYLLKESALRQIAYSPKSKNILKNKLSVSLKKNLIKYKIPYNSEYRQIIDDVITKLEDQGFLNNDDFIKYFINKNKNKSWQEIDYLLKKQGFSNVSFKSNDKEKIKKILIKKDFSKSDFVDFHKKNKIVSSLYRKGFSFEDIKAAIDCFLNSR